MNKRVIVTALQTDIVWGKPQENATRMEAMIKANAGSDLYVLPEMWSTGFATGPEVIAEKDEASLQWMKRMAKETGAAIAGSVATDLGNAATDLGKNAKLGNGGFRNRLYFVKPTGEVAFYDKHHLFTYGQEDKSYKAGEKRTVVEWKGVRFVLLVCYDLRFPVWSRSREDYDAMIYVASWPKSRQEAWSTLLRARAIENQSYVIGVNRVGDDPQCHYAGGTAIIDAYGHTLKECKPEEQQAITAEIDMEALEAFRKKFPVLKDRDIFHF